MRQTDGISSTRVTRAAALIHKHLCTLDSVMSDLTRLWHKGVVPNELVQNTIATTNSATPQVCMQNHVHTCVFMQCYYHSSMHVVLDA
jgi:hypothetical protein